MNKSNAQLFAIIKTDHRIVSAIIEEIINRLGDGDGKLEGLYFQLKAELEAHIAAEEQTVYPKLIHHAFTHGEAHEGMRKHSEIRVFLNSLEGISVSDDIFEKSLLELKAEIERHVEEEENEIFSKMQDLYSQKELDQMASDFELAKQALAEGGIAA